MLLPLSNIVYLSSSDCDNFVRSSVLSLTLTWHHSWMDLRAHLAEEVNCSTRESVGVHIMEMQKIELTFLKVVQIYIDLG